MFMFKNTVLQRTYLVRFLVVIEFLLRGSEVIAPSQITSMKQNFNITDPQQMYCDRLVRCIVDRLLPANLYGFAVDSLTFESSPVFYSGVYPDKHRARLELGMPTLAADPGSNQQVENCTNCKRMLI